MPVSVPTSPNRAFAAHRQRPAAAAFAFVIGTLFALPSPSWAQALRADVIAAEQAEKAKHLGPGAPTHAEQIVTKVRDTFLQPRDGLYPFMDSVYGGGGFTLGAGSSAITAIGRRRTCTGCTRSRTTNCSSSRPHLPAI